MRYRKILKNRYLCITVCTDSKRISKLVENVLDLDNSSYHSKPKIKIEFYLDEIKLKNPDKGENFLCQNWLDKDKNLLSSIGNRIATVTADHRKGIVKGAIFNYQESSKERLLDLILMQPLRFILSGYGLFFLHTSVVCKGKDCIIINGPQNSGKSTLALTLAQNGFNLLSDDDCFVKVVRKQPQLFPFSTKMGLNDRVLKRYPELNKHTLKNYRYGGKQRIPLNHISNHNHTKGLRCKMIIFPRYQAKRNIYMKGIPKEEALNRFIKENPAVYPKKQSEKMFWALYNLTNKANAFELIYNDERLDGIPEIINKNF